MLVTKRHQWCSTGGWLVLVFAALGILASATLADEKPREDAAYDYLFDDDVPDDNKAADKPAAGETATRPQKPKQIAINTLQGIVVSKQDGKPLADVAVAMADKNKAYIFIRNGGRISTYGRSKKVFLFFNKPNGQTACETKTDKQGRFALKNFASMSAVYSIVAGSKEAGLAIVDEVTPKDFAKKTLRIEIDEPTYVKPSQLPAPDAGNLRTYTSIRFAPTDDDSGDTDKQPTDDRPAMPRNVHLIMSVASSSPVWSDGGVFGNKTVTVDEDGVVSEDEKAKEHVADKWAHRIGPVVGSRRYLVSQVALGRPLGYSPILFSANVLAPAGETTFVRRASGRSEVTGRIAAQDGPPLANVNVMVRIGETAQMTLGAITDENGSYSIANVPPGDHRIELLRHAIRTGPG